MTLLMVFLAITLGTMWVLIAPAFIYAMLDWHEVEDTFLNPDHSMPRLHWVGAWIMCFPWIVLGRAYFKFSKTTKGIAFEAWCDKVEKYLMEDV